MSKKSAKKRRPQVPKIKKEVTEDLYQKRKGAAKERGSIRRLKKLMKHIVVEETQEDEQATDTVPPGEEGEDLQLESLDGGSERTD